MKATETEGVAAGPATWPPVDAIDRVGPGGSFLAGDHTLDHFRSEFWFPKLIDRSRREKWEAQGSKTLGQRVRAKVIDIIEHFEPPRLPAEDKLKAICKRADELYGA